MNLNHYTDKERQTMICLFVHINDNLCNLGTLQVGLNKEKNEVTIQYVSCDDEYYYDWLKVTNEDLENEESIIRAYKKQAKQVKTDLPIYEFYDL